jgi:hypothetical protein
MSRRSKKRIFYYTARQARLTKRKILKSFSSDKSLLILPSGMAVTWPTVKAFVVPKANREMSVSIKFSFSNNDNTPEQNDDSVSEFRELLSYHFRGFKDVNIT